jgi:hypothetical protein
MRQENADACQNKNSHCNIQHRTGPKAHPVLEICTARLVGDRPRHFAHRSRAFICIQRPASSRQSGRPGQPRIPEGRLQAWSILYPTINIRYRLTLDVDVDGVRHSGSGVVEFSYSTSAGLIRDFVTGGAQGMVGEMHGNAITVDLGDRGLLFVVNRLPCITKNGGNPDPAFFDSNRLSDLPLTSYQDFAHPPPRGQNAFLRTAQHQTTAANIPLEQLPMLLRLSDLQDRNSAQNVDPRDLAAAFGPGVRLVKAVLQVTSNPITPTPASWPRWLTQEKDEDAHIPVRDQSGNVDKGGCLSVGMFKKPL